MPPTPKSFPTRRALPTLAAAALAVGLVAAPAHASFVAEAPIPTASSGPVGTAAGPDSAVWFTENNVNKIGRLSTSAGTITETTIPTGGSGPYGIAAGIDG